MGENKRQSGRSLQVQFITLRVGSGSRGLPCIFLRRESICTSDSCVLPLSLSLSLSTRLDLKENNANGDENDLVIVVWMVPTSFSVVCVPLESIYFPVRLPPSIGG